MSELFDEVDEEVRREQLKKLWDQYSIYIVAGALLIIAAVGGWRGYQYLESQKAAEAGAAFDAAVELAGQNKHAEAEAEKKVLLEKISKPSGVSEEERMKRAAAIIERAVASGLTEVQVYRFPNTLCTDRGRAINQQEPGWETTLTGLPKELYEFWNRHLRPRGYKLRVQIVDFPDGYREMSA